MNITVILCTYNRAGSLSKALESVASSALPKSVEWEILVVDNNSRDHTREVVEEFCGRYPGRFRYLFEPRQGLSQARNAGIREARGDILAFMDDDVTVEPTWLENLTANLQDGEWSGAGGRILPEQGFSPPRWLALYGPYAMGGFLALFDRGDTPRELDWAPFGTNMAFRREMFEKYGGFRTDLGRCGDGLLSGEDTEFGRRLVSASERLHYEPSAVVYHPVPENRLRKEYFLAWSFGFGRSLVREWGPKPGIWGIPRPYFSILRTGPTVLAQITRWMLAWKPQQRFFYKVLVWRTAGEIVEKYRLARHPDKAGSANPDS
jgi:glucosyl-dolichyl phosphate glucuronosyltransferase